MNYNQPLHTLAHSNSTTHADPGNNLMIPYPIVLMIQMHKIPLLNQVFSDYIIEASQVKPCNLLMVE